MRLNEICRLLVNWSRTSQHVRPRVKRRDGARLALESLEDRTLPSSFTAATVSDLIADIDAANQAGGSNTIALAAGATFLLTAVNNTIDGPTGLPVIAANDNLTIQGNSATVARSTTSGTPAFRLFDVAQGASLTLANLTLQGGLASSVRGSGEGGAIYNQGTLDLNGVTVQNNIAQGGNAYGGGICSDGTLTLEGGTKVLNNQAVGGQGGGYAFHGVPLVGYAGGSAYGGGVCVLGGTATLSNSTVSANTAQGGAGGFGNESNGAGGNAYGGGVAVLGGTVTLTGDTLSRNSALGGSPRITNPKTVPITASPASEVAKVCVSELIVTPLSLRFFLPECRRS
jgi:hypothetical protein